MLILGSVASGRFAAWRVTRHLHTARYWQGRYDVRLALHHARISHRALATVAQASGILQAEVLLTLAEAERDAGDPAAHEHFLAGHAAATAVPDVPATPGRKRLLARATVGLGDSYRRTGYPQQALDILHRAVTLVDALDPPVPQLHAAALTALAITAKECGDFETAARMYARVEAMHAGTSGDREASAVLAHNRAGLAYARGRYAEAEDHARTALAMRGRKRPDQLRTAFDRSVLAAALAGQHRYDEARDHLRWCLHVYRHSTPVQHYEISVNAHILADVDRACGDLAQAEAGYREALTIREQLLGPGNPDHPEIAAICANLATLLYQLGRHREAANLLGRASRMTTRGLPAGHPVAASIRRDLRRYRSDRSTH